MSLNEMSMKCYEASKSKGFWEDCQNIPAIMTDSGLFTDAQVVAVMKAFRAQKLMLIVSELAEALEGDRKDSMDDKLPHRTSVEVEMADAQIRIFDFMGGANMDLQGAVAEKLQYNASRPYKHNKSF